MVAASGGARAWSHPATAYPEPVRAELARRREQILVRADGRVLDLDDPAIARRFESLAGTRIGAGPLAAAARDAGPPVHDLAAPRSDGRYDTVVATGVLAGFADLGAITSVLAALVADDGALLFVEPVGAPGWSSVLRTSIPSPGRGAPWRSLHLDRDVPAAVRAAGLVVCDLDRGELPAQPRSLRHWVSGRAVRIPAA
jgi:hypothetical protein